MVEMFRVSSTVKILLPTTILGYFFVFNSHFTIYNMYENGVDFKRNLKLIDFLICKGLCLIKS